MTLENQIMVSVQYFALCCLIYFLQVTHFPVKSTYSRQMVGV
jgi:hypothetical protein